MKNPHLTSTQHPEPNTQNRPENEILRKQFDLLKSPLEGTNLIEANAGTGKTYAISKLFLRLLLERKASITEILVVTFTEAATHELKERIRKDLIEARDAFSSNKADDPFLAEMLSLFDAEASSVLLRNALRLFDDVPIFTIHGFCHRSLKDHTFESGLLFETELVTDQKELVEEIAVDFWRRNLTSVEPEIAGFLLERLSLPMLIGIFRKIPLGNKTPLLPEPGSYSKENIDSALSRYQHVWKEMGSLWQREGNEISRILLESPALNRTTYKEKSIHDACDALNPFLNANAASKPSEKIELFTTAKLSSATKKGFEPPEHPFFHLTETLLREWESFGNALEERILVLEREFIAFVKDELRKRKEERNICYFDDLLTGLHEAVHRENGKNKLAEKLQSVYKAALIDEFQDTDSLQYGIFRTLFGGGGHILFLIGDPKQSIYRFRGADIFAYLKAVKEVERRYSLTTNYRSEAGVVSSVNAFFTGERPFFFDGIQYLNSSSSERGESNPLTINGKREASFLISFLGRNESFKPGKSWSKEQAVPLIAKEVASEIANLLQSGKERKALIGDKPLEAGDIAVLVRSHRQAARMKQELEAANVPSVLDSTDDIFRTEDVDTLLSLLTAFHQPGNPERVKAALISDALGWKAADIEALSSNDDLLETWLEHFGSHHKLWNEQGFIAMFSSFLKKEKVAQRLLGLPDGERRLTNIVHLSELLHHEAMVSGKGAAELIKWLTNQQSASVVPEDHEIRLERDGNAVRIVTVHKSKGLEYPIVFCPFLSSGKSKKDSEVAVYHAEEGQVVALRPNKVQGAVEQLAQEELAEDLRLLYVALTRAKCRCYLNVGHIGGYEQSALAYLLHQNKGEDFLRETSAQVAKMDDQQILSALDELVKRSSGSIVIQKGAVSEISTVSTLSLQSSSLLACRSFSGKIADSWRISSFTSMVAKLPVEVGLKDHDEEEADEEAEPETSLPESAPLPKRGSILSFPAGAKAGIFFHDLLENLDFAESDNARILALSATKLEEHGFSPEWREPIADYLRLLVSTPLFENKPDFTLSRATKEERLNELEFHYPLLSENAESGLRELCMKLELGKPEKGVALGNLLYLPKEGFMKGFIDLVFRIDGRFYLVDWKSNLLGKGVSAYRPERIREVMTRKLYTLQYHIYVAALHRYLRSRLPGYRYDDHFGGVLYLFLRGIHPENGWQSGVYYDKPELGCIEKLL